MALSKINPFGSGLTKTQRLQKRAMDSMNPKSDAAKFDSKVAKFRGMSKEKINEAYRKMSDDDKKKFGKAMAKAHQYNKKEASKSKSKPKPKPTTKPGKSYYQGVGEKISKAENKKRKRDASPEAISNYNTGSGRDGKFGSGTRGKGRPTKGEVRTINGRQRRWSGAGWIPLKKPSTGRNRNLF